MFWSVRPSYSRVSVLSNRTFERQFPVMFGPLKVSPKASWVLPFSPLNHITPTSVPYTLAQLVLLV